MQGHDGAPPLVVEEGLVELDEQEHRLAVVAVDTERPKVLPSRTYHAHGLHAPSLARVHRIKQVLSQTLAAFLKNDVRESVGILPMRAELATELANGRVWAVAPEVAAQHVASKAERLLHNLVARGIHACLHAVALTPFLCPDGRLAGRILPAIPDGELAGLGDGATQDFAGRTRHRRRMGGEGRLNGRQPARTLRLWAARVRGGAHIIRSSDQSRSPPRWPLRRSALRSWLLSLARSGTTARHSILCVAALALPLSLGVGLPSSLLGSSSELLRSDIVDEINELPRAPRLLQFLGLDGMHVLHLRDRDLVGGVGIPVRPGRPIAALDGLVPCALTPARRVRELLSPGAAHACPRH